MYVLNGYFYIVRSLTKVEQHLLKSSISTTCQNRTECSLVLLSQETRCVPHYSLVVVENLWDESPHSNISSFSESVHPQVPPEKKSP